MSKKEPDEYVPKRRKKEDVLKDLDDLDSIENIFLVSSVKKKEEEKKEEKIEDASSYDGDWLDTLTALRTEKKRHKGIADLFGDSESDKKKKKKKKKENGPVDHSDDFEREIMLLQSILNDQTKLSSSLQSRYDSLDRQKSAARGVGKFTTDLITTLNTSRSLSKDIVKEIANIKKNIAELNMKEKEKFAKDSIFDGENMGQFASSYLKQIMGNSKEFGEGVGYGIDDVSDGDDFFDDMEFNMRTSEGYEGRSDSAEKYLKYEGSNVSVKVMYDKASDTKTFIAEDEDGNIIDDYPLPKTIDSISINHSTLVATDRYGKKYPVIMM